MAGNGNSGRNPTFSLSENKLDEMIARYKIEAESGEKFRASWPHFCAYIGYTEAEVAEIMDKADDKKSAYSKRGLTLRRLLTWVRGQVISSTAWDGQQTKANTALKHDYGDGVTFADNGSGNTGPSVVQIEFGGGDPRAKQAFK